jgi:hypothetical protein
LVLNFLARRYFVFPSGGRGAWRDHKHEEWKEPKASFGRKLFLTMADPCSRSLAQRAGLA